MVGIHGLQRVHAWWQGGVVGKPSPVKGQNHRVQAGDRGQDGCDVLVSRQHIERDQIPATAQGNHDRAFRSGQLWWLCGDGYGSIRCLGQCAFEDEREIDLPGRVLTFCDQVCLYEIAVGGPRWGIRSPHSRRRAIDGKADSLSGLHALILWGVGVITIDCHDAVPSGVSHHKLPALYTARVIGPNHRASRKRQPVECAVLAIEVDPFIGGAAHSRNGMPCMLILLRAGIGQGDRAWRRCKRCQHRHYQKEGNELALDLGTLHWTSPSSESESQRVTVLRCGWPMRTCFGHKVDCHEVYRGLCQPTTERT